MNREEELLHRVLAAEAAKVDVEARALVEIRQKIKARRRRWWQPVANRVGTWLAGTAVALSASVAAVVIGFGSCAQRPYPAPGSATPTAIGGFGASVGPSGALMLGLPVYYLAATPDGPVLYREFHQLPAGDGSPATRTATAVTAMLTDRAFDPDYTSGWPATTRLRGVSVDDGVVTVDLTGAADLTAAAVNSADPVGEGQAVQQLIWTATAASGLTGVRLLLDGQPVDTLWGAVAVAGVLHRAPAGQVQAPVWLIDPQHGSTVGKTFTVRLAGIVVDGVVGLRVRDVTHAVVLQQTVTLSRAAPEVGEASVRVTLPSGTYSVEAYHGSATDGGEQGLDNHTVTVR